MLPRHADPIAAIATAPGRGGVGIVRISGKGLAPLVREEIWRCLDTLRAQGQTILVIDKYVQRLVALADRHVILERGNAVWQGTSAELNADRSLWHEHLGV